MKILALIGGISQNSLNKKLYHAFQELAPDNVELDTYEIMQLPHFSQDMEKNPADHVVEYKEKIKACEAVLFVTPEYNRSFPGVLKNAIDWGSRPYGQNLWKGKPGGLIGASIGNIGTFGAQHHLRQVLAYLDVAVMGQPEFYLNASKAFDARGHLTDASIRELIENYWTAFIAWIEKFEPQEQGPRRYEEERNLPLL